MGSECFSDLLSGPSIRTSKPCKLACFAADVQIVTRAPSTGPHGMPVHRKESRCAVAHSSAKVQQKGLFCDRGVVHETTDHHDSPPLSAMCNTPSRCERGQPRPSDYFCSGSAAAAAAAGAFPSKFSDGRSSQLFSYSEVLLLLRCQGLHTRHANRPLPRCAYASAMGCEREEVPSPLMELYKSL